ncbi:hypothetical protein LCGC14_1035940 [marine sediment metagenome]|uniref:ParB-like N-terminal domain-containing protein n=1 Tax=marine sediment metagenome TaxID=412755 RepID=A0A0F9MXW0_9ZZZZ
MEATVKRIPVSEIRPSEYNPRVDLKPGDPEYEKIKKSILEFGLVETLVVNKHNNRLIGGHQRLKVIKELGWKTVSVSLVDIKSLPKEKALNIALNKIQGDWNLGSLATILSELDGIDLDLTGFDGKEVAKILKDVKLYPDSTIDNVPGLPVKTTTRLGDLFQLGRHRLLCGDSTKIKTVKRLIGERTVDMALTDPPYGVKIVNREGTIGRTNVAKAGVYSKILGDETTKTARACYDISTALKIQTIILWGGNYYTKFCPPGPGWIVWDKRGDMESNHFADCEMAWTNQNRAARIYRQLWSGMIKEGESDKRVHPTQKPVALSEWCFDNYGEPRIVLDLFGGSGSTLIAAENSGRQCLMMELDPRYCDVIVKRFEKVSGKKAKRIK